MKPLVSASIAAPGFYGLNTQESSVTLAAGFALQATNCVIDEFGRLGARKGYRPLTTTPTDFKVGHEFIDVDGTTWELTWTDTTLYKGATDGAPVAVANAGTAPTAAAFDCSTLNDKAYFVQAGDEPRYFDPTANAGAGGVDDISAAGNTVTNLAAITGANCSLSAYGRLWLADTDTSKTTVYWSNLLDGTDFDSGSAGSLDLSSVLVRGNDEIVALGAHAGRLIIFCKRNIVIYQDTDADQVLDPANMRLVEVLRGYGCISRDSVQNTGSDIIFLSNTGLMSLGRLIQEKSQPMRDLSKNIRDELISEVRAMDETTIKSVYSDKEAFYLLYLPQYSLVYCFDMRQPLQDGSSRVTAWDSQVFNDFVLYGNELHFLGTYGCADYFGYNDDDETYRVKYYTNYFDFNDGTKVKYLKRLGLTLIGGSGQDLVLKAGFDYEDSYISFPISISEAEVSEYGVAEYGDNAATIAYYTTGTLVDTVRAPIGGSGNIIQVGFEATVDGSAVSIQKLDIYTKEGRVY